MIRDCILHYGGEVVKPLLYIFGIAQIRITHKKSPQGLALFQNLFYS